MTTAKRKGKTTKKLITAEELIRLPDDGKLYELLDGALVEMSPPGAEHGGVTTNFTIALGTHVREHELGVVLSGDPGVILRRGPDRVRAPDVCFISKGRLPGGRLPIAYLELVPDLIVEIVSPGDTAAEVEQKAEEWLSSGARLVWNVYPRTRSVVAYRGLGAARLYSEHDELDGGDVLPDFRTPISLLFS